LAHRHYLTSTFWNFPVPVVSSIFLVVALVFAVVIGPQTRPWTWGPAMLALGVSVLAALPTVWRRGKYPSDFGLLALGALTAGWFAWRAWISPVAELGQADLLLVCSAAAVFLSVRAISGNPAAEKVLAWGIALLLAANVMVIVKQVIDPDYLPVFKSKPGKWPSGFFGHYNEAANYLIASSALVGAAALYGRHAVATRIFWALIAIAGLAAVWYTRSRGGIFGAAVAFGVFAAVALTIGKRRSVRWFAPALVAIPLIGLGIGGFLYMGWQSAQELRHPGTGVEAVMDNNCRLYFLGLAASSVAAHPLAGGGSRSFSWECFRFADPKVQADTITHRPEFVHNELVQSATDYGLVGFGLLVGLLGALALGAILRVFFEERPQQPDARDAWRLGALAALAGMLVQSSFSFVFHLLPGVILLGICLGKLSRSGDKPPGNLTPVSRVLLTLAAVICAMLLIPAAWRGTQVTRILWPTHFSKLATNSAEARIESLTAAIRIWPQATLYQERATAFQTLAGQDDSPDFVKHAERAIADYAEASGLHPFEPVFAVNRANLLSQLKRDGEAEDWYAKAITLQGGMEPGYRGHFSLANHYLRKSLRLFDPQKPEAAHASIELAAEQMETSVEKMHWIIADMREPRVNIHESLGAFREAVGDREGALESYNFATTLPGGTRAHYRAGAMMAKVAIEEWSKRRPAEAMKHFLEARKRLAQAGGNLPYGITPSQSLEFTHYLDEQIALLKAAKVQPAE
jgi:tetratricopeptide (TPR) repeat protein